MTKGKRKRTAEELFALRNPKGKERLKRFVMCARRGGQQAPDDMAALAAAFEQILSGEDPKKALGLAGGQSQGRTPRVSAADIGKHEEKYVFMVEQYRRDHKATVPEALEAVAKRVEPRGPKFETIKIYRKEHGENVRAVLDLIEGVRKEHAALTEGILKERAKTTGAVRHLKERGGGEIT